MPEVTVNDPTKAVDLQRYSSMDCPLHGLVTILSGPWTTYILWLLRRRGPMRFGQLKKQMPSISAKVLTERLRMLEQVGIIDRHHEPTIPPKVTYSLTARGHELEGAIDALDALALKWSGRTAWN
jgi:DNA-binding HxlR family transcriptional regulator